MPKNRSGFSNGSNDDVPASIEDILNKAPFAWLLHDHNNQILGLNERARALLGLDAGNHADCDGSVNLRSLICNRAVDLLDYHLRRVAHSDRALSVELPLCVVSESETQTVVLAETSIHDSGVFQTVMLDVTEHRQAHQRRARFEKQLHRAQKLETLHQLSAGIAHDFNNLLQILDMHATLAISQASQLQQQPLGDTLRVISESIAQGSRLTGRLLSFSRDSPLEKEQIDLRTVIANSLTFLGTALARTIDVKIKHSDEYLGVWVDSGQIEQLLVNLYLNSRDAAEEKCELRIQTSAVSFDRTQVRSGMELFVGRYAKLTITDNGSGIPESIRERIFEPFFTTREPGKGTGLGLAIAQTVLRQHEGAIELVESSSAGTTFAIYLPTFQFARLRREKRLSDAEPNEPGKPYRLALVADDEPAIRSSMASLLQTAGIRVLTAEDGANAMDLIDQHPEIELVLSDVVMPVQGGLEVCDHYRRANGNGKVVLISGHGDSVLEHDYLSKNNAVFIPKPFDMTELRNKLGLANDTPAT